MVEGIKSFVLAMLSLRWLIEIFQRVMPYRRMDETVLKLSRKLISGDINLELSPYTYLFPVITVVGPQDHFQVR